MQSEKLQFKIKKKVNLGFYSFVSRVPVEFLESSTSTYSVAFHFRKLTGLAR